jgi:hypothetical protein
VDEQEFWTRIERSDKAASGDMDQKSALIKADLALLPKQEALAFLRMFHVKMDEAYSWALWGAAHAINGGCDDDTFSDFRASLISRGRQAFERALSDPDSLADESFDEGSWFYEGYQYAISDGVRAAAGNARREKPLPVNPAGRKWSERDLADLYPKLTARFGRR